MGVIGNTQVGAPDGIPQSSAIVPGRTTPIPIQGSTNTTTDNQSNETTPVNMNLKQVGDVVIALGQALKAGSIPVTLASDQGTIPVLDTNSAASKADLDILAGIISANKAAVKAAAGDFADLATLAAIVSGSKAAIKS